ncbi:MAG: hypothetical protein FJX61_09895 [Alphaproteobacteria bacterium]|nr:hypothetical protein [Alphaproteobacteria bacterium]
MTGRIIGAVLLLAGVLALGADLVSSLASGDFAMKALGAFWYELHPGSLNLLQAVVQRYITPELWDPVIVAVLLLPTWAVAGGLGLVLLLLFRARRRRPDHFPRRLSRS